MNIMKDNDMSRMERKLRHEIKQEWALYVLVALTGGFTCGLISAAGYMMLNGSWWAV